MNTIKLSQQKGRALLDEPLAHGAERLIKLDGKHYWIRHYRKGYEIRETAWVLDDNGNAVLRASTTALMNAQPGL